MDELVDIIAGARPNFVKIAPIIQAFSRYDFSYRLIHTGQHYDNRMSDIFFSELMIPPPDVNLNVGTGTQTEQTARIMVGYEKILLNRCSNICLVVGDVTSTMACAIVAQKMGVRVAHVEGGIRSDDWKMSEEINRILTDSITNYFFTTSRLANENLLLNGIKIEQIYFVGNTMADTLLINESRLRRPSIWKDVGLENKSYFVVTLHRPVNVDEETKLIQLLKVISNESRGLPIIFPIHLRTAKILDNSRQNLRGIKQIDPISYLEFNYLVKHAKCVITDSGGITEEATMMRVPCMTLRDSTERPETVTLGTSELLGTTLKAIKPAFDLLFSNNWKKGCIPEKWDGKSSERIAKVIKNIF